MSGRGSVAFVLCPALELPELVDTAAGSERGRAPGPWERAQRYFQRILLCRVAGGAGQIQGRGAGLSQCRWRGRRAASTRLLLPQTLTPTEDKLPGLCPGQPRPQLVLPL